MLDLRDPERRGAMVIGVVLVGFGVLALVGQALAVDVFDAAWPLFVIVPGLLLFAWAVSVGGPAGLGLAIPGAIVTVIGAVLAVQEATGLWATWAYVWALVAPGGVGLGMVLYGLVTGQPGIYESGKPPLFVGLGLFFGFGLFFEGVLGLSGDRIAGLETPLAAGLILLGVIILAASISNRRSTTA